MALHIENLCLGVLWCVGCCQRGLGSLLWCHPLPAIYLCTFPWGLYEWTVVDEMFRAATMIAVFLLHLGILYNPWQVHHKLFGNSINSTWIFTLFVIIAPGILFLQMCQMHSWHFHDGLVALEFPHWEETGSPWFWRIIGCLSPQAPGQLHRILFLSFLGSP